MPKLRPPKGYAPYKGAESSFQPSADGMEWYAQYCEGPRGWGMYVFRQSANGSETATEVPYAEPLMANRGHFELGGNGVLYVTGGTGDKNAAGRAEIVNGFVPFVVGKAPVIVNPASGTDSVARTMAQQAQDTASHAQKAAIDLSLRIDALVKKLDDTVKFIQDSMWQKALDAAYFVLKQRGLIKDT